MFNSLNILNHWLFVSLIFVGANFVEDKILSSENISLYEKMENWGYQQIYRLVVAFVS